MKKYVNVEDISLTDFEIAMCHNYKELCEALLEKIEKAPAADVRPVIRGQWIESEKAFEDDWGNIIEKKCICSACGFTQKETNVYGSSEYIRKSNFCPNCGADMRESLKEVE